MKNLFLFLSLSLSLFISSCKKECDIYHTGSKCETETRIQYYGTYVGTLSGNGQTQTVYNIVSTHADGVEYLNCGGVKIKLTSASSFQIPQQIIYINQIAYNAEGNGSFSGNQLIFTMYISISGGTVTPLTFTGTK